MVPVRDGMSPCAARFHSEQRRFALKIQRRVLLYLFFLNLLNWDLAVPYPSASSVLSELSAAPQIRADFIPFAPLKCGAPYINAYSERKPADRSSPHGGRDETRDGCDREQQQRDTTIGDEIVGRARRRRALPRTRGHGDSAGFDRQSSATAIRSHAKGAFLAAESILGSIDVIPNDVSRRKLTSWSS